jgi:AraC-like DNA-binding protein
MPLCAIDACWSTESRDGGRVRVLPDGCVDLLFSGGHLFTSELLLEAQEVDVTAGAWFVGVRFAPGHAGLALPLAPAACVGRSFRARDLDPSFAELERRLQDSGGRAEAFTLLSQAVTARVARAPERRAPPDRVRWAIAQLPKRAIHDVAAELGVSERTLARLVEQWTGLTPKHLSRALRLQQVVRGLRAQQPLVDLALEAGFADQPHLTREVRRMTGLTPRALRHDIGEQSSTRNPLRSRT